MKAYYSDPLDNSNLSQPISNHDATARPNGLLFVNWILVTGGVALFLENSGPDYLIISIIVGIVVTVLGFCQDMGTLVKFFCLSNVGT